MSINLPKMLAPSQGLALRQGVVTGTPDAINLTCDVFIAGNDTAVTLKYMHHVSPIANDPVWIMQNGTDMLVIGKTLRSVGSGSPNISIEGIELYHPASTPYIDFHRGANPAGDSNADYNIRIINDASNRLKIRTASAENSTTGGLLLIGNAYVGSHPVHGASWAGFGHITRMGSPDYQILCHDNGEILFNTSGSVKRFRFYEDGATQWAAIDTTGLFSRLAKIGTHPVHTSYAWFGHKDVTSSSLYCLLQNSGGETILNGSDTYIREDGSNRFQVSGGECHTSVRLNISGGIMMWSDWIRCRDNRGIYFEHYGGGWMMQDTTYIRAYGDKVIYSAGMIRGDGGMVARGVGLQLKSHGDNTHRIYWHTDDAIRVSSWSYVCMEAVGHDHATFCQGQTRHVNRANNAWRYSDAAGHTNFSDPRGKRNMESIHSAKGRQRNKLKEVSPIRFKFRPEMADPEGDRDHFGFSADELPEEVVHLRPMPDGRVDKLINSTGVLALLWQICAEQEETIEALEARLGTIERMPAIAINKKPGSS